MLLVKSKASLGPTRNIIDRGALRDGPVPSVWNRPVLWLRGFYILLNYIQPFAMEHFILTSIVNNVLVIINASSLVGLWRLLS